MKPAGVLVKKEKIKTVKFVYVSVWFGWFDLIAMDIQNASQLLMLGHIQAMYRLLLICICRGFEAYGYTCMGFEGA